MDRRPIIDRLPREMTPNGVERGEWFVARRGANDDDECQYLHRDGVWRGSTFSCGWPGRPTGYFETRHDAEAALAKVRGEIT